MKKYTIERKPEKGVDGKKVTTIRISEELFDRIESLVIVSGQSRNYVINRLLEIGLDKANVEEKGELANHN